MSPAQPSGIQLPFEARRLTGCIGAELAGLDLLATTGEDVLVGLHTALLEFQVVFVPGQHLGPGELLDLATRLGEVYPNPLSPKAEGFPDVTELVTDDRSSRAPEIWHFDTSYAENPPAASLLSMVRCPAVGGDTMWVNMYAVYESLSAPMREFLDGLTVAYDSAALSGRQPGRVAEHPMVRRHPETGRTSLYFDRCIDQGGGAPSLRERCAARVPALVRERAEHGLPVSVVKRGPRHVGQPVHPSPGGQRFRR